MDFSDDFLIEKLEARGLRVHLAPKTEWLNYCSHLRRQEEGRNWLLGNFSRWIQQRIEKVALSAMSEHFNCPPLPGSVESLAAAAPYVSDELHGEAVLTVAVHCTNIGTDTLTRSSTSVRSNVCRPKSPKRNFSTSPSAKVC